MALRGTLEYFDCWASQDPTEIPTEAGDQSLLTVQTGTKKYTAALEVDLTGGDDFAYREAPLSNPTDATYGRWVNIASRPSNAATPLSLFGFYTHGLVGINSDGKLHIFDGGGTIRKTGLFVLSNSTWYWVTIRVRKLGLNKADIFVDLYDSSGVHQELFSAIDVPTVGDNMPSLAVGSCYSAGNGAKYYLDGGLCVSGTKNLVIAPDFWSDVPTGVGSSDQWTSSVPGNKWEDVDDTPANGDTDYVTTSTSAKIQHFTYPASGLGGAEIRAVGMLVNAERLGNVLLYVGHYLSGSSIETVFLLTLNSYTWAARHLSSTKPGGGEWTTTDLDNAETRLRSFLNGEVRVSSVPKYAVYGGTYKPRRVFTSRAETGFYEA